MTNEHKCPVHGCRKKLDEHGYPVEFCDFQQGRCPMYKSEIRPFAVLIYILIFVILFGAVWLNM